MKHVLIRRKVPLLNARGQCFDGAKNMCNLRSDMSTQILSESSKAFFTHCFEHVLNWLFDVVGVCSDEINHYYL